jgi:hypothetical protein
MGEIVNFRKSNFIVFPQTQVKTAKPSSGETDKKPGEKESEEYKERFLWLAQKYQKLIDELFKVCISGDAENCIKKFAAEMIEKDARWTDDITNGR